MSTSETSTSTDSDPASKLSPGQKLAGVYVLRRQANGPGADSPIWLAHDEVLGKDVSLHFLPSSVRADNRAMNELRQEIKRNRQLIHPNILRVYDLIEEADWAAISMDSFEGESLAAILAQKGEGFFEPGELKPWIQQICVALEDVHKINLVHRNISPPNLFVDRNGKVLIANFGVSRTIEDALGRSRKAGEIDRHLVYMSPQQLDGESPSKLDDIYSFGVTLYELLTGQVPFTSGELVSQIRKAVPESMMERRGKTGKKGGTILPPWEKAIAACLAKNPAERPQTDLDLAGRLGVSGKLAAAEPAPPAPNVAAARSEPIESAKTIRLNRPGERKPTPPSASQAAPAAAPLKSYAEIVAAVEADEREATLEPHGEGEEEQVFASSNYPSLYSKKSRAPVIVFALIVIAAAIGAYVWYTGRQQTDEQTTDSGTQVHSKPSIVQNGRNESAPETPPRDKQPATPAPEEKQPIASATPEPVHSPSAIPFATPGPAPAVATRTNPAAPEDTQRETRPTPVAEPPGSSATPAPLLADNKSGSGKTHNTGGGHATPAPAPPATPAPTASASGTSNNAALSGSAADDPAVAKLRQAADAAEKKVQELKKQQQDADAAAADLQKKIDEKTKSSAALFEATKELKAQRQQREDQFKAADLAAQDARKAAEEKSKLAEDSKKALADWDAQNASKLSARDAADADLQALQKSQAEKRNTSSEASKALAEAENANANAAGALQAAAQKAAEAEKTRVAEEERKASEKKAAQRVELDTELQKVDAMRKELEARMKAIQDMQKQLENGGTTLPSGSAVPASSSDHSSEPSKTQPPAVATTPAPGRNAAKPIAPATPSPAVAESSHTNPPLPTEMVMKSGQTAPPSHPEATPEAKDSEPSGAFENSLGMKFVPVGDVLFCIWPTRVKDFDVFAKETGLRSTTWRSPGFKQGPDHPVVDVTWTEAMAFCKWLTERDRKKGLLTNTQMYRLPTDIEWSKGVGLPEETGRTPEARDMGVPDVFPWGTQWPPPPNVGNYTGEETGSDVAIKGYDDGFAWTSPVGSFPPNKYGLYDMGGNVWQWCMDSWNNESKAKVLRGASWYNGGLKLSLLSSCRVNENPDSSTDNYGFRIVRATEPRGKGK